MAFLARRFDPLIGVQPALSSLAAGYLAEDLRDLTEGLLR